MFIEYFFWFLPFTIADPCYAAFHDEEWGVPVHDDKYAEMAATFSPHNRINFK